MTYLLFFCFRAKSFWFVLPIGRRPKELERFVYWRDEHRQFVEIYGYIGQPEVYPAKENVLQFRGGRPMKAAEWIPPSLEQGNKIMAVFCEDRHNRSKLDFFTPSKRVQ